MQAMLILKPLLLPTQGLRSFVRKWDRKDNGSTLDYAKEGAPLLKSWMAGSSPAMTSGEFAQEPHNSPAQKSLPPQRQRHPVQIQIHNQPGLAAGELHHGAALIGEHHSLRTADHG